jgi:hypothetical protein
VPIDKSRITAGQIAAAICKFHDVWLIPPVHVYKRAFIHGAPVLRTVVLQAVIAGFSQHRHEPDDRRHQGGNGATLLFHGDLSKPGRTSTMWYRTRAATTVL